jgi:hypothetical protein
MRTDIIQGSTYRREGGNRRTTIITKAGSIPGFVATAPQEQAFFSSLSPSFFLEPTSSSSTVVALNRLLATTVSTQAELTAALANNARIELGADILLTSEVTINGLTGVVIDGKGFKIDGNNSVRCFNIQNGAEVALTHLTITRGSAVSQQVITFIYVSFLSSFRLLITLFSLLSA